MVGEMYDLNEKDWQRMKRELPTFIQREKSYAVAPMKDPEGRWQWVNLEYFFPWGNWMSMFKNMADGEIGRVINDLGLSNPFFDVVYSGKGAVFDPPKDLFTGKPIYNKLDEPSMKAMKMIEWIYTKWAPAMLTRGGAADATLEVAKNKVLGTPLKADRWGTEMSPARAFGKWVGLNLVPVNKKQVIAGKKAQLKDLRINFSRINNDP